MLDLLGALGRGAGGVEVGRSRGCWEEAERVEMRRVGRAGGLVEATCASEITLRSENEQRGSRGGEGERELTSSRLTGTPMEMRCSLRTLLRVQSSRANGGTDVKLL